MKTTSEMLRMRPAAERNAIEIMERFAERTGLTSELPKRRDLWTDAFAVCNFLGLVQVIGEARTWLEHQDINEVMLSTSLVPTGFLVLAQGHAP